MSDELEQQRVGGPLEELPVRARRYEGRVAVVVGGGGAALGRASSRRLAAEGAHVVCVDRTKDAGASSAMAAELGGQGESVLVDLLKHETVRSAFESVIETHGRIDTLFNLMVAGRTIEPDGWQYTLVSSFAPTYFGTLYGAELMSRHGGGSIVNTSSDAGITISPKFRPTPLGEEEAGRDYTVGRGSYGAAKAGVWHYTKEAAMQYARRGVRVNCISPGYMATPLTTNNITGEYLNEVLGAIPMGRFGQADDVAAAVAFLGSDDARYLTGQLIMVDGGFAVWGGR